MVSWIWVQSTSGRFSKKNKIKPRCHRDRSCCELDGHWTLQKNSSWMPWTYLVQVLWINRMRSTRKHSPVGVALALCTSLLVPTSSTAQSHFLFLFHLILSFEMVFSAARFTWDFSTFVVPTSLWGAVLKETMTTRRWINMWRYPFYLRIEHFCWAGWQTA